METAVNGFAKKHSGDIDGDNDDNESPSVKRFRQGGLLILFLF